MPGLRRTRAVHGHVLVDAFMPVATRQLAANSFSLALFGSNRSRSIPKL